jgi:hypothetical protein
MTKTPWLEATSPAFRLMIATSWLAPDSSMNHQELTIRQAIAASPDWAEYIRLVDRHRTPALSWAALKRVPDLNIPEPIQAELKKRSDSCRMLAVKHSLILAEVLKAFNRAAIPVMPLKGPILSFTLYGDIGLRQSHDLDLAVPQEDFFNAQSCLQNQGWRLGVDYFSLSPRQLQSCLLHEHHLGFLQPQGNCLLELHWRNQWEAPSLNSDRWARSIPSIWQGAAHQAMHPIDLVLYLCSHGAGHAWSRAKWLGDMARIHAEGRVDWEAVLLEARRTGQHRALLACPCLLQDVYGLPLPVLRGNPWKDMPSLLIDKPSSSLKDPKEPVVHSVMAALPGLLSRYRYNRMVHSQRTWRETVAELAHCRVDFRVLRLPDRLFWAYVPLRPILWFWRRVLRRGPTGESFNSDSSPVSSAPPSSSPSHRS